MIELNKIYLGDSLELLKQVPDNTVDLVVTDPPYKFEVHGRGIAQKRDYLKNGFKDIKSSHDIDVYSDCFINELIRVSKKVNFFFFCNKAQVLDILKQADKRNYNFEIIVFCKNTPTPLTNNQWLPDKEYGIHIFKNMKVYGNYKTKRSFFVENSFKNNEFNHPTVKPLHIVKQIIKNISEENDIVLDPFVGSGTTVNACIQLNRQYLAYEINPKYYKIATDREKRSFGNVGLFE